MLDKSRVILDLPLAVLYSEIRNWLQTSHFMILEILG